jgi:hypothetical protein
MVEHRVHRADLRGLGCRGSAISLIARLAVATLVVFAVGCGAPVAAPQTAGVEKVFANVRGIT